MTMLVTVALHPVALYLVLLMPTSPMLLHWASLVFKLQATTYRPQCHWRRCRDPIFHREATCDRCLRRNYGRDL